MTFPIILLSAAVAFPTPQVGRPDAWHSPTNRSFTCSPSIAVAPNGRLWASWFCARLCNEEDDSYAILVTSSDGGATWKEVAWADPDRTGKWRTFDPGLWIAPDGKLHWTFSEHTLWRYPDTAKLGYTMFRCVFPDPCAEPADLPEVERFTQGVMLGRPFVASDGAWIYPLQVFGAGKPKDQAARVYASTDGGRTISLRGAPSVPDVEYGEHSVVELKNGDLWLCARTKASGLYEGVSSDGGRTWRKFREPSLKATNSRPYAMRLKSGRVLLVKNGAIDEDCGRKKLSAYLSDDECRTWKGGLVLEPGAAEYPCACEDAHGVIRVVYDRQRYEGADVRMAAFTEEDVLAGRAVSSAAKLDVRISAKVSGGFSRSETDRWRSLMHSRGEVGDPRVEVTRKAAGTLVALFSGNAAPGFPVRMLETTSTDGGITWSYPEVSAKKPRPAIVPYPRKVAMLGGAFPLKSKSVDAAKIRRVRDAAVPAEGYRLRVAPDGISVASSDDAGAFYAVETLKQLAEADKWGFLSVPCCEIEDSPAYRWRGVLLDEGRHFFGKGAVKRLIDQMAMHKLNVLQWHFTEDPGWRIEVPGYPELVKYGAVRPESPAYGAKIDWDQPREKRTMKMDGERYGPFYYTEADLREVVAYAAERHVEIVPEIELPGHSKAALAAYPRLACFPENCTNRLPRTVWGIEKDVYCAGNDEVLAFLRDVLDYVCSVFPSKVVHIGGDECPRDRWKACPRCQKRIRDENLKDESELQAWLTRKMAEHLAKKGRRLACWNGVLNCGFVSADATGMLWRPQEKEPMCSGGNPIVNSSQFYCYLDYGQGLSLDPFLYIGNTITLEKAYSFDPATSGGIPESERGRIVGGQMCCWSEFTWNVFDLDWKTWPRGCALAESFWTGADGREFGDFLRRMKEHRRRLVASGVNCAPLGDESTIREGTF